MELDKILNAAQKVGAEANKKTKKEKRINIKWKNVLLALIYASSLFVTALKEFVKPGISIDYILTNDFWSAFLLNVINNWILLFAMFIFILDKLNKSDTVSNLKKQVNDTIGKVKTSVLYIFLDHFNRDRKKKKYKYLLEVELEKIDSKATKEDHIIYLKGTEEEKQNNKYCKTKKELLKAMEDKYLEDHIDEVYIHINVTTKNFLKYGYTKIQKGYVDPWEVESGAKKFVRDLAPKLLFGLALLLAVQSFALEAIVGVQWQSAIIAIIFRLYPIATHTYIGVTYAKQYHLEKTLVDLDRRLDIVKQAEEYQTKLNNGEIKLNTEKPVKEKSYPVVKYREAHNYG